MHSNFGEGFDEPDGQDNPSPAKTKDLLCKSKFSLPLPQGERVFYFAKKSLEAFSFTVRLMIQSFFPPLLPPQGKVGIVAPSRWPSQIMLDHLVEAVEASGYQVVVHKQCSLKNGTLAGSDAERAQALMDMFVDPSIKAILCARGGSGAMMVIDRLDYDLIRQNPKPIVGVSDLTALLQAITNQTGMVTFHGPVGYNFLPSEYELDTHEHLFSMIGEGLATRQLSLPLIEVERAGTAQGRLVGGNMCLLEALIGTPYDWAGDGAILFIEEVNEPLYRIERMLAHFRLAGKFKGVRAVLVGEMVGIPEEIPEKMENGDVPYGRTLKQIMLKHLPPDIPLAFNVPCGHGRHLMTFPVGASVSLTLKQGQSVMEVTSCS